MPDVRDKDFVMMSRGACGTFEFHVSRAARERYGFDDRLFSLTGNVVLADLAASRALAHRMNQVRDAARHPERAVHAGQLHAMGLIDEILHVGAGALPRAARSARRAGALDWLEARGSGRALDATLLGFTDGFPPLACTAAASAADVAGRRDRRRAASRGRARGAALLWLANVNPAFAPFPSCSTTHAGRATAYRAVSGALREYFESPARGSARRPEPGRHAARAGARVARLARGPARVHPAITGATCSATSCAACCSRSTCSRRSRSRWMRFHPPGTAGRGRRHRSSPSR